MPEVKFHFKLFSKKKYNKLNNFIKITFPCVSEIILPLLNVLHAYLFLAFFSLIKNT